MVCFLCGVFFLFVCLFVLTRLIYLVNVGLVQEGEIPFFFFFSPLGGWIVYCIFISYSPLQSCLFLIFRNRFLNTLCILWSHLVNTYTVLSCWELFFWLHGTNHVADFSVRWSMLWFRVVAIQVSLEHCVLHTYLYIYTKFQTFRVRFKSIYKHFGFTQIHLWHQGI